MSYGFLSSLTGLILILVHLPTDKSVGYFRSSLRDWDSCCVLILSSNANAGSSAGCWGTRRPRKARARLVAPERCGGGSEGVIANENGCEAVGRHVWLPIAFVLRVPVVS